MALGSTQPLTETSTRNLPEGKGRPARKADNHGHLWADCLENVGASTIHSPMGLHGLLQGLSDMASSLELFRRIFYLYLQFPPGVVRILSVSPLTEPPSRSVDSINAVLSVIMCCSCKKGATHVLCNRECKGKLQLPVTIRSYEGRQWHSTVTCTDNQNMSRHLLCRMRKNDVAGGRASSCHIASRKMLYKASSRTDNGYLSSLSSLH
jgi:hypothetical protein